MFELLAHVFEEEVLAPLGVERAEMHLQRSVLGRGGLRWGDVVQFGHLGEHLVAPFLGN